MNKKWLILAIVSGSFAPGIALGLASIVSFIITPEPNKSILMAVLGSLWLSIMFAAPVLLFFGLPLFLLFRALGIANIYTCIVAAISPVIIAGFFPSFATTFVQQIIFGLLFLVSALSFWYFAKNTVK
jgi:hypothetical protein